MCLWAPGGPGAVGDDSSGGGGDSSGGGGDSSDVGSRRGRGDDDGDGGADKKGGRGKQVNASGHSSDVEPRLPTASSTDDTSSLADVTAPTSGTSRRRRPV